MKKFTEASNEELWTDFKQAVRNSDTAYHAGATPFTRAVDHLFGRASEPWCCRSARMHTHVRAKDGTRMKVNYCPSCGRKLYL